MDAVVVSYNSQEDLAGMVSCDALLSAFDEITVIDNGSTDGGPRLAREAGLRVIVRPQNNSFGAAANEGVRHARTPLVAILNPDIRLQDRSVVSRLVDHFDQPNVALAVPQLRLRDGRLQDSVRAVPTPVDLIRRRMVPGDHDRGAIVSQRACDVPWAVGAFMVVRRTAFEQVRGFDERFRLYFEDVDLCVRLRRAGWRIRFDPSLEAMHWHRAASRGTPLGWAMRQHVRSATRFYLSNPRYVIPPGERVEVTAEAMATATAEVAAA